MQQGESSAAPPSGASAARGIAPPEIDQGPPDGTPASSRNPGKGLTDSSGFAAPPPPGVYPRAAAVSKLYTPLCFPRSTVVAPNRFVRSATARHGCTEDGKCTDKLVEYYERLAAGGCGTIITGHCYVQERGKAGPGQMSIASDDTLESHRRLVEAVRRGSPECVVVCQLAHAGPNALRREEALDINSASQEELEAVARSFADAAVRASRAGYDGVQIHSAHSYFLSSSLSPTQNHRTDGYGPCVAPQCNARLLEEVLHAVLGSLEEELSPRERASFLVGVKLQTEDRSPDGQFLRPEDAAQVASRIAPRLAFVEISGGAITGPRGTLLTIRQGPSRFYYQRSLEEFTKLGVGQQTAVIITGGLRDLRDFDKGLDLGAELIGMSRPFYRDIKLVERLAGEIGAASEASAEPKAEAGPADPPKTGCFSCNRCCQRAAAGDVPRCPFSPHDV